MARRVAVIRLFDQRMADGSRHFADLPESYRVEVPEWEILREHVPRLAGAEPTGFVTDHVTEAWIDFDFAGHHFSLNNQHGQWWFFVQEPSCPESILETVLAHFEDLLVPAAGAARRAGPLPAGHYRVVAFEPDLRTTTYDCEDLEKAVAVATDCASETEHGTVLAYVVDAGWRVVHVGRHYQGQA